ncbi:MAG: phosphoadenylyl-sulfate reductase [Chloroflexi bacterium]|nr:MAG: phosphoadenylyl-sulfate reductase [Chloroflexota bacterium]MBL1194140.1 phosphoadenylyl-sulfate reductase [Chloroflexota bacterium]
MNPSRDYVGFKNTHPQDILHWAVETYQEKLVVVTSFQPTGIVGLHMLQKIAPDLQVITLDTGLLFPETYSLIERLKDHFELNLCCIQPALSLEEQAAQYGEKLWESDPDKCCYFCKVLPLQKNLLNFRAWITGLRRDQSPQRGKIPIVMWDKQFQIAKISPFANWTENMIWEYIKAHDLPYNELHERGFPSIGCEPCTVPISVENTNNRDGRWPRHNKVECGIHFST